MSQIPSQAVLPESVRSSRVQADEWMTLRELAEWLKLSVHSVYEMNKQGLPRIRVGVQMRYRISEVEAWLERRRRGDIPAPK